MKMRLFLVAILLFFSNHTKAENGCPDGMAPGQTQSQQTPTCFPIPNYSPKQLPQNYGHWETRWGAIAIGRTSLGTVVGMRNKRTAVKAALSKCKSSGNGTGCAISITFYNQCGVIAWGDSILSSVGGPTIEAASKTGLKQCSQSSANCKIYYAECSHAEWVQ